MAIFDWDDTLVKRYTDQILPGVEDYFRNLRFMTSKPRIAIATNAGYVGLRYWREQAAGKIGDPNQTPPKSFFDDNLIRVCAQLTEWGGIAEIDTFRSFRYQAKSGKWSPIPEGEENNPEWNEWWRKPSPGMLFEAMSTRKIIPAETIFVGDMESDLEAASRAGCRFQWSWEFFERPDPKEEYVQSVLL